MLIKIVSTPFAAYFMALLWAAFFGDTFNDITEKSMIEEWIICVQIYIFVIVLLKFKPAKVKKDE